MQIILKVWVRSVDYRASMTEVQSVHRSLTGQETQT